MTPERGLRSQPAVLALAAVEVREGESKQGLCLCFCGRRRSYCESPYRDCSDVKDTPCFEGRFPVREAKGRGACSHEGIAGRLRRVAVTEVDAYDAQGVNVPVGGQADDLRVGESSRPLGCQNGGRRDPLQCRRQVRGLSEHHLYIGQLLLSDLPSIGQQATRLGQRSGMTPEAPQGGHIAE
jgi:hypothetical protein